MILLAAGVLAASACGDPRRRGAGDDDAGDDDASGDDDTSGDDDVSTDCTPEGSTACWGNEFMRCADAVWTLEDTCVAPTPLCDTTWGCVACVPDQTFCDGNSVHSCLPDGTGSTLVQDCEAGELCVGGDCLDACDLAEQQMSYLGCRFLAVSTSNIVASNFDSDFAVVIGAPAGGGDAEVTVSRGGAVVASVVVADGDTAAIELPMVTELERAQESVVVVGGAYQIVSTVPVAAYQYSPLHFDIAGTSSFTNDASLLLPEHTLTGNYMVSTWPTWGYGSWDDFFGNPIGDWNAWHPGFVAIAATADATTVTFQSSTITAGGNPGSLGPNQTTTITLDRGDVVQIFSQRPSTSADSSFCASSGWQSTEIGCPPAFLQECEAYCSLGADGDLTGSTVQADQPVAVIAGHMCTFMPYDQWACDHLEEMMFPVETWGDMTVMSAPTLPDGTGVAPTLYRAVVQNNATTLTFTPAVNPPVTLDAGQFVQLQTDTSFMVEGTDRFYVTQTLLGEDALPGSGGDPAMGSGIPWLQVRDSYDFLTPPTYTSNYVNVIAPSGGVVELDGAVLTGWDPIGSTGFDVARVPLQPGAHHVQSQAGVRFGITAYGYAPYTSYLYPGGLNFTR